MVLNASVQTTGQGVLPAPPFRRSGDYVFVSSIYPVDETGQVLRAAAPSVGESDAAGQTRHVLETLREILQTAGSSLQQTLRAEVYLVDAADFYEFKLVWKEFFPADPPARTTIVVGDDHVVPGCRLNLHVVALAGDAASSREVVHTNAAPDLLEAEHAAQAVKAGPFVFPSAFPATDFRTGVPVGKRPGFPYYGSDAELQADYVCSNLAAVLEAAGTSITEIVKTQFYETDLLNFHDVDGIWAQYVGVPPTRSSMACRGFLVPGALFAANTIALVPDERHRKEETRAGIRWHPVDVRKVNFSPGIRAGEWLFTAGQIAVPDFGKHEWVGAPAGLPHHFSEIEIQTEFTMELLGDQLTANGLSLADVVDARVYLIDARKDYRGFARAWRRIFAGVERMPSMSVIPARQASGGTGIMFPGPVIEIDLVSRKEEDR